MGWTLLGGTQKRFQAKASEASQLQLTSFRLNRERMPQFPSPDNAAHDETAKPQRSPYRNDPNPETLVAKKQ